MGKLRDSLHEYNRAIELDPHDAKVYYNRGNTYLAMGYILKSSTLYNLIFLERMKRHIKTLIDQLS